jgi:small conductance mechanosensitive channel
MPQLADLPAFALGWLMANAAALASALITLIVGMYLSRFAYRTIRLVMPRARGIDRNLGPLLAQAARYGIMVFAIVTALGFLGVNNSSILAVLGTAGFAIVLSLQNTLANIAAGVMLLWLRPIAIGEYIIGDGVAGVVVEVGLFGTRLRSTSGLYIFTPNLKLWNGAITNHTREKRRRVEVVVTVPDDIDIGAARRLLLGLGNSDSRVLADPAAAVHVASFSGGTINMELRCWVNTPDYLTALYALTEAAKLALDKALAENARKNEVTVAGDASVPSPDTTDRNAPG